MINSYFSRLKTFFSLFLTFGFIFICFSGVMAKDTLSQKSGCTSEEVILKYEYLGACGHTSISSFTLPEDVYISRIRIWYDTDIGEEEPLFFLSRSFFYFNETDTTIKGDCVGQWCEAWWDINELLEAGDYQLFTDSDSICSNPSGQTTLVLYGCAPGDVSNTITDFASLGAEITDLQFYESGSDDVPYEERLFSDSFAKSTSRFINYQISVSRPETDLNAELTITARIYGSDGSLYAEFSRDLNIPSEYQNFWWAHGWGSSEAGGWPADTYTLKLFDGKNEIARGNFTVFDGQAVEGQDIPDSVEVVDASSSPSNAPVYLGKVLTGGNEMEVSVDFPAYNQPVDIWLALVLPDGRFYVADESNNIISVETTGLVPFTSGVYGTAITSEIVAPFETGSNGTPFDPWPDDGTWTVYWVVAPESGGDISKAFADGKYELGFYTFEVHRDTGEVPDPDIYLPGEPASNETTPESRTGESLDGSALLVTLDDATSVSIPELPGAYEVTLERADNDLQIVKDFESDTSLVATGSMRHLLVTGSDDPSNLKPVITIPAQEAGSINLDTVNVLRVGDVLVDGEIVNDYTAILPVSVDENGNLCFTDALMPDGLLAADEIIGTAFDYTSTRASRVKKEWIGSAHYVVMSFQDDLNWKRQPQLVRMIPDSEVGEEGGYRHPATSEELTELAKKPICNLVVLVHGHNEEEKEGIYTASEEAPWLFGYKRRVWDLLYKEVTQELNNKPFYPYECTAFYEFIFPTYRPIYSPVSGKTGQYQETLGESLGKLIDNEIKSNSQLNKMLDEDMPFNIFFVAHSQGGLVSRAGFQFMPEEFKEKIVRFVSWGSPHHGSALTTLLYALQAGHDMIVDEHRLPLQTMQPLMTRVCNRLALDTPGTRDLRWEASRKDMLNIRELFPSISNDAVEAAINPPLFNENLVELNYKGEQDIAHSLFYGTTTQKAKLLDCEIKGGWHLQCNLQEAECKIKQIYKFAVDATDIQKGAKLNDLIIKEGYRESDGAVPVYSQKGAGILGVESKDLGNTSHEEFYGGEPEHRNIDKGTVTAQKTFAELDFTKPGRSCPVLEAEIEQDTDRILIKGKLDFPMYDNLSNIKLGDQIKRIEAREDSQDGEVIDEFSFTHEDDASFQGEGILEDIANEKITVVAILKDDSEVALDIDISPCEVDYSKLTKYESPTYLYYANEYGRHGPALYWFDTSRTQLEAQRFYCNGEVEGLDILWWANGNKRWEVTYSNGEENGPFSYWHDNGNKDCEGNNFDGYLDGFVSEWYYNGIKKSESNYTSGKLDGLYKTWHENGVLSSEVLYANGSMIGIGKYWDYDGECDAIYDYDNNISIPCP